MQNLGTLGKEDVRCRIGGATVGFEWKGSCPNISKLYNALDQIEIVWQRGDIDIPIAVARKKAGSNEVLVCLRLWVLFCLLDMDGYTYDPLSRWRIILSFEEFLEIVGSPNTEGKKEVIENEILNVALGRTDTGDTCNGS